MSTARWRRPVPLVGDTTSAAERAARPDGWALPPAVRDALHEVVGARRHVRRFRPDPVGHSQPWRFVVVTDPATRDEAAWMADRARLAQACALDPEAGRRMLDLQLEGIPEAPVGIVVCCDRRAPAEGVLGRASFGDADVWSCACAIQNLWLAARAEGTGVGWVTLFERPELAGLVGLPDDVTTLGWRCVGWPHERPPEPGLERAGWSARLPVADVVLKERWPAEGGAPPSPCSPRRSRSACSTVPSTGWSPSATAISPVGRSCSPPAGTPSPLWA